MKRKRVRGYLLLLAAISMIIFPACSSEKPANSDKVTMYTSTYVLEDFAKKIGGDYVEVNNLLPAGVDSHDFEPSAKDLAKLNESDIFIYNGAGLESWVEKSVANMDKEKVFIVNATDGLPLLTAKEATDHQRRELNVNHDHNGLDPHVWLDPTLAQQQAAKIRDALIQVDPVHKTAYEQNYGKLEKELEQLDQEWKEMVDGASKKEFITSHKAFGYLAHRYGLQQISISGVSPQDEPSPSQLKEIIQLAKNHQVEHIIFVTLVNPKVAKTVQQEVKAEALVLNPLEGLTKEERAEGADYFSVMRSNKEKMAKALGVIK